MREWQEAFRHGSGGFARELALHVRPWDIDLALIDVPVHIFHGEHDRLAPISTARWLAARLARPAVHWYPGEGHDVYLRCAHEALAVATGSFEDRRSAQAGG